MAEKLEVRAPYNGELITTLDMHSEADAERALAAGHALAKNRDDRIPLPERIAILERTADAVEKRVEEYALQAAREGGKPLVDSRVELVRAVQGIREAARSISQLVGREIPMNMNPASAHRKAYTFHEPIGLVAAVSAFNHPFNLIVHQVVPAVAVGCPVIVKPALVTPMSCFNLVNELHEAGLPKEWCQVVLGSNSVSEKIVTDERVSFFSFIGSPRVGWMLRSKLAPGTRCALEHGGAAPVIMDRGADIESALPLLAKGGYYHAGQVCVSVQRVYVHKSQVDKFVSGLTDIAKKLVVGDPTDEKTEVGPLIREGEVDRVDEWVVEAKNAGGNVVTGGERTSASCYAPTVIVDPPDDVKVSQMEIFGPVIVVYSYEDRLHAIDRANDVPFSFQAAVFTNDLDAALDSVQRLDAAAVMVNDHTAFRVDWMPFGGRKSSGLGMGGILPSMQEMTEEKMVVIRSSTL